MSKFSDICGILNDAIFDSVKVLEFGKEPLHDVETKKQWARNLEAYVNYIDGYLVRLRQVYREIPQDKPYYQTYLTIIKDIMGEMGTIISFHTDLAQPQMLERVEMLLSLLYSVFSSCLGLGNMALFAREYPLTPDDMSMYMEMKVEEKRRQRLL